MAMSGCVEQKRLFPLFADVKEQLQVVIGAGEALYIAPHW